MKKGFTLVELLAVIIILGTLSLLIIPKVIKTLNDSEQKTNLESAKGLLKAAEYKYQSNEIKGIYENIAINFTTGENIDKLDYTGAKPEKGRIQILSSGKIAMSIKIEDNCYKKLYTSREIEVIPYREESCGYIPEIVTSGDGLYESTIDSGKLIYRGSNPNNYITLKEDNVNDVLYRIVSFESDGTIKVVRNEKINTNIAWDASSSTSADEGPRKNENNTYCNRIGGILIRGYHGCNVWGNMNNTYYNGATLSPEFKFRYFTDRTSNTLQEDAIYKGTVNDDSTLNTYLNEEWLNGSALQNYIEYHTFDVGGIRYNYYGQIGEDKGIETEKKEESLYTWKGKIGLLNITDYVESSTNPSCTDVWSNYDGNPYFNSNNEYPCKYGNYNYKSDYEQFSLTAYTLVYNYIWTMEEYGAFIVDVAATTENGIRPAFYLKSNVNLDGIGTMANPYYIIN